MINKTREDIINDLLLLDEEVSLALNDNFQYEIVIVGGSALLLINKITRATSDIDAIKSSIELRPYMIKYDINDRVVSYKNNFDEGYYDRKEKVDIPTKKINIYTASLEDIVISKLCSQRPKDIEDINNPLVYQSIDWEILDKIIYDEDFKYNMLNEHNYNMFMLAYRDYKEMYRK